MTDTRYLYQYFLKQSGKEAQKPKPKAAVKSKKVGGGKKS